jgi:hypothetical protein
VRAAEVWYAIRLGNDHIGYSYVLDETRLYNGASCRHVKNVVAVNKAGLIRVKFNYSHDLYFDSRGLLAYSSTRDDDGVKSTITGTRGADGLTLKITKNGKTETKVFPAGEYDMTSLDVLPTCLRTPGDAKVMNVVDLDLLKVKRYKLTYIGDEQLKVKGRAYNAAVVLAKTGTTQTKYWLAPDRHTAYRMEKNSFMGSILGLIKIEAADKTEAIPR